MSWVRTEDTAPDHPKLVGLEDSEVAMWWRGLCYASRYRTDGAIPKGAIRQLSKNRKPETVAAKLVAVGLWEETPDGFRVHDYLDYNLSAAEQKERRDIRSAAGKLGGKRSGSIREAETKQDGSETEASASTHAQALAEASAQANDKQAASKTEAKPKPNSDPRSPPYSPPPGGNTEQMALGIPVGQRRPRAKRSENGQPVPRPADWAPKPYHYAQAQKRGLNHVALDLLAEKFVAGCDANGRLYCDWDKGFTTWILNEGERRAANGPAPRAPLPEPSSGPSIAEQMAALRRAEVQ